MKKTILASFAALFVAATASAQTTKTNASQSITVFHQQGTAQKVVESPADVNTKQGNGPTPSMERKPSANGNAGSDFKQAKKMPMVPKKSAGSAESPMKESKRSEGGKK